MVAAKKPGRSSADCDWPRVEVENLRRRLNEAQRDWPAIAKETCLTERYLRAFARSQIYCPPFDRFSLIARALTKRR
jgi:hypothetical protein